MKVNNISKRWLTPKSENYLCPRSSPERVYVYWEGCRVDGGKFRGRGERRMVSLGRREGRAEINESHSMTGCQCNNRRKTLLRVMKDTERLTVFTEKI